MKIFLLVGDETGKKTSSPFYAAIRPVTRDVLHSTYLSSKRLVVGKFISPPEFVYLTVAVLQLVFR